MISDNVYPSYSTRLDRYNRYFFKRVFFTISNDLYVDLVSLYQDEISHNNSTQTSKFCLVLSDSKEKEISEAALDLRKEFNDKSKVELLFELTESQFKKLKMDYEHRLFEIDEEVIHFVKENYH